MKVDDAELSRRWIARMKSLLKTTVASLSDQERHDFFRELTEGYCLGCGTRTPCTCQRDD